MDPNNNRARTLVFASVWHFLPEGVRKVTDEFTEMLRAKQLAANVSYRQQDDTFLVEYFVNRYQSTEDMHQVEILFLQLVKRIVEEEQRLILRYENDDDEDDTYDDGSEFKATERIQSNLICRIGSVRKREVHTPPIISSFPIQLGIFPYKEIWVCPNDENVLYKIVPVEGQELIGRLTGTKLVEDLNNQRIFIGGIKKEDCHRAIHKLDSVRRHYVFHVFYSEEFENFQICLKPLYAIKKKLVETTLLSAVRRPGGDLAGYKKVVRDTVTARCCVYNNFTCTYILAKGKKFICATKDEDRALPMKLWKLYTYPRRGDEFLNPMGKHPSEEKSEPDLPLVPKIDKARSIMTWQENLANLTDSFQHSKDDETNLFKESTIAKIALETLEPWAVSIIRGQAQLHGAGTQPTEVSYRSLQAPAVSKHGQQPDDLITFSPPKKSSHDNSWLDWNDEKCLATAFPPLLPIKSSSTPQSSRSSCYRQSSALPMTNPKLQQQSEVDTRTYHSTMRQGAPRKPFQRDLISQKLPIDPIDDFGNAIEESMEAIFNYMRGWHGEATLEAQFGRILIQNIHPNHIAFLNRQDSVQPDYLAEELTGRGKTFKKPEVYHTRLLTSVPGDIEYLLDIKDVKGRKMWKSNPTWAVKYQIECVDEDNDISFVIEINAETCAMEVKSLPYTLGEIYVHGTLRNWDYQITAWGYRDLEKAYGHVAKCIIESLYVPDGMNRITTMNFQIKNTDRIEVKSVHTRRIALYESFKGESILNITEVDDLCVNCMVIGDKKVYHAFHVDKYEPLPSREKVLPLWFEVGIVSRAAQIFLQQNLELEYGNETDWTSEDMKNKAVANSIYDPACHMLKNMDGVGFWNDNGFGPVLEVEESVAEESARFRQEEQVKPNVLSKQGYW